MTVIKSEISTILHIIIEVDFVFNLLGFSLDDLGREEDAYHDYINALQLEP